MLVKMFSVLAALTEQTSVYKIHVALKEDGQPKHFTVRDEAEL